MDPDFLQRHPQSLHILDHIQLGALADVIIAVAVFFVPSQRREQALPVVKPQRLLRNMVHSGHLANRHFFHIQICQFYHFSQSLFKNYAVFYLYYTKQTLYLQ